MLAVDDLALSVSVSSDLMGFAPYGRLTFFACAKKVSKETHPYIRPRLRRGSLVPSPLHGHAEKGHPWPITALAASMPLNPFHGDSTRPPEGDLGVVCAIQLKRKGKGQTPPYAHKLASPVSLTLPPDHPKCFLSAALESVDVHLTVTFVS